MVTLSNVDTLRGSETPRSIEAVLNALPEAVSGEGVSVRYAPAPGKQWFALRATYGREQQAAEQIVARGFYAYVARRYTKRRLGHKLRLCLESLIPNMVFAYVTEADARQLVRHTPQLDYLEFYYNRLDRNADGFNPPLVIPEREMENFILTTRSHNEHIMLVAPGRCHFRSGDRVRVTQGAFCGVEGLVARVAGQQRVVIHVAGVGLVTTAYVPTAFLEKVDQEP